MKRVNTVKKIDIDKIVSTLKKEVASYQVPVVDLVKVQTNDPFKILIATILSARTKDETTTEACKRLFQKVKNMDDLKRIDIKELQRLIYPVGFYLTKAKHLKQLPIVLKEEFNNKLPETVDELVTLPGVGRKTANLVVTNAFEKPAMCVDTHVHRISNRFGYVRTKTPFETEMALRKKLPKKHWIIYNSILVAFGQNLCKPISPFCTKCPIINYCNRIGVEKSR